MKSKRAETIGVLFGGRSAEHEVSVITGHQAMDALQVAGHDLLPIYITKEGEWYAGKPLHNIRQYTDSSFDLNKLDDVYRVSLSPDRSTRQLLHRPAAPKKLFGRLPSLWPDIFFPTIHGSFGEDGTLQGLFELADVAYTGSNVIASAIGMDKVRTKALYRDAGLPVLDCISITRAEWAESSSGFVARAEEFCEFPLVVKPVCLGSSIGVKRCDDSQQLAEAIEVALELDESALVERALVDFVEINCSVLGPPYQASVCEQPITSETVLTFDAKYKRGAKGAKGAGTQQGMASLERHVPAPISPDLTSRIQELSIKAFQVIGASGVARVDFLLEKNGENLYLNEINTMPGSLAFYLWEAAGVPLYELVSRMVKIGVARHKARSATRFYFQANLLQRER